MHIFDANIHILINYIMGLGYFPFEQEVGSNTTVFISFPKDSGALLM